MNGEENKRQEFLRELEILHYAGVGVMLVRTREERRAINAIEDFAFEHSLHFRKWNVRDGWQYKDTNDKQVCDKQVDPVAALNLILDVDFNEEMAAKNAQATKKTRTPLPEGVFVMSDLHYVLEKHPALIRGIREYAAVFSNNEYRLIVVVPEGFAIPPLLATDMAIVDFDLPSRDELSEVLDKAIRSSFVDENGQPVTYDEPFDEDDRYRILNAAIGMTANEAEVAMARSIVQNETSWPNTEVDAFMKVIMAAKTEVIKRSNILEIHEPMNPKFVGGMDLLVDWVIQRRKSFTPEAAEFGVRPPKGVGLFGVPGTGKSLMAKVIAYLLGMPLIRFDVSRVFSSLVGSTEANIRSALKTISALSPCCVWVDEIDKAGLDQNGHSGDSGTSDRVLQSLLTHMAEQNESTFWIFTANRTAKLPPEMLRKGRLEELFNVAPPNKTERREILKIHLQLRNHDDKIKGFKKCVDGSVGYVGAELEAAVNSAVSVAFAEEIKVTGDLILEQLKLSVPIREAFADDFEEMRKWAQSNARPTSTPDEDEDEALGAKRGTRKLGPQKKKRSRQLTMEG